MSVAQEEENIENKESELLSLNEYMEIPCMQIESRQKEDQNMNILRQILLLPKWQWKSSMEKEENKISIWKISR